MDNDASLIPSFGGIIGSRTNLEQTWPSSKVVISTANFKLLVFGDQKNGSKTYHNSNSEFLWTGGLNLGDNFNLNAFNYFDADHKFVYVTYSNSVLSICTDHYSKIPLLYIWKDATLFFATSLEYLFQMASIQSFQFNRKGLLFYYNFGFPSFNETLVDGVKSLSGGQQLKYENGQLTCNTYFDLFNIEKYKTSHSSLKEHIHTIDSCLLASTQKVLESNSNIGIALSGGVDSGYLAQKINECGVPFKAYTIGFKDDYNEFERVDYLSRRLKFSTKKIILSTEDIISNYLDVTTKSSFPVGFNNSILNFIYKEANQDDVDVMFDGDGADRLFLGMNKYLQLQKILNLYTSFKSLNIHKVFAVFLKIIKLPQASKLRFYFLKFNNNFPFYGERKLSGDMSYDPEFEKLLNDLALPKELKELSGSIDKWLFFSLFSVYYTPTFFFHTPYELQLRHGIVSNPQFWSDDMVNLALRIPLRQKLHKKTTKMVLREAAKLKIDDGYWNLSKIGLQNSYQYMKQNKLGKTFINDYLDVISQSDEYLYLKEMLPSNDIEIERLLPYWIWKENLFQKQG